MARYTPSLFVLLFLMLATSPIHARQINISINDYQFLPNTQTVDLGDSVKWTNNHTQSHDVTEKNFLWASIALIKGDSFTQAFNTAGSYSFYCSFHPGMTGKIIVRTPKETQINIGKEIITQKPKRLPIALNLDGKNTDQVYLGSYIVNAQGGCADCHSCPSYAAGHDPFKGETKQFNASSYLAGGKAFGPFVSANLTPDSNGKPDGMTLNQFKYLMRSGKKPHITGDILQVMPWPVYGNMSDVDLEAMYAYLSSIPKLAQPSRSACQ
ncbi:MAG: cupredoxin domain-containing protein [Methylovulum sp.]|nr:cupredoxin domain-containing protein [Methylovulum sp.]